MKPQANNGKGERRPGKGGKPGAKPGKPPPSVKNQIRSYERLLKKVSLAGERGACRALGASRAARSLFQALLDASAAFDAAALLGAQPASAATACRRCPPANCCSRSAAHAARPGPQDAGSERSQAGGAAKGAGGPPAAGARAQVCCALPQGAGLAEAVVHVLHTHPEHFLRSLPLHAS